MTENLVLLVGLLYKMCQLQLVYKSSEKDGLNRVNTDGINKTKEEAAIVLEQMDHAA